MTTYRISQLAEMSGVPASTLRFYEDSGLLLADRTPAGYRVYDDAAVERLTFISSAKLMGLTLEDIRVLLGAWSSGVCSSVRSRLAPLIDRQIAETDHRLAELTAFAARLQGVRSGLSKPAPDGGCGPDCGCMIAAEAPSVQKPPGAAELGLIALSEAPGPARVEPVAIACTLGGDDMQERTLHWQEILLQARDRHELDSTEADLGLQLTFDNDAELVSRIAYLIAAEQQCCSFYSFTMRLAAGEAIVEVRAPHDARPLVAELFGLPE